MSTTIAQTHLWWAWAGVLAGMSSGAAMGLAFHNDAWLGGYGSWQRRMLRLGHISFFGIAFLNFAYANTAHIAGAGPHSHWVSPLLIAGAVLMPTVCALAAWLKPLRHLFALPVVALVGAAGLLLAGGF
jgi:hypothetical protein